MECVIVKYYTFGKSFLKEYYAPHNNAWWTPNIFDAKIMSMKEAKDINAHSKVRGNIELSHGYKLEVSGNKL